MACSGGPMKAISFRRKSSGNLGNSEAWPQPAQTACTPVRLAMSRISWMTEVDEEETERRKEGENERERKRGVRGRRKGKQRVVNRAKRGTEERVRGVTEDK